MFSLALVCMCLRLVSALRLQPRSSKAESLSPMVRPAVDQMRNCATLGCNARLEKGASCQCRSSCARYGDCCEDYEAVCGAQSTTGGKSGKGGRPPAVVRNASCMNKLPLTSRSLQVGRPTPADLARLESTLAIYMYSGSNYKTVRRSSTNVDLCYSLFPHRKPMVWTSVNMGDSSPVCILAKTKNGTVQPVFWSDYNEQRGLPNFVAYVNRGLPRTEKVNRNWKQLPKFNDKIYGPSDVISSDRSHCQKHPDSACQERVSSRGHFATLSHLSWDRNVAAATNTYVNTAPARQPFDGQQWNAHERQNAAYAEKHGPLFVVKGPSLEIDGLTSSGVEVPSMFWAAVYNVDSHEGTAWMFRNGFSPSDPGCIGADGLSFKDIETSVGVKLWPGAIEDDSEVPQLPAWH